MSRRARQTSQRAAARESAPRAGERPLLVAALAASFLGAALFVYQPCFRGPFISDDIHYVRDNPYVHELSLRNVRDVLDPGGPLLVLVENYAPVHVLLHGVGWQLFGEDVRGHHVVNVVLHVIASLLLAAWLWRVGLAPRLAAFGGAVFLLHPANVEAVAWVSQLKTTSCMVLSLAALLLRPRRPLLGALLFALALLAKATAAFALPVALVSEWVRRGTPAGGDASATGTRRTPWLWIGVWAVILAVFAVVELGAFQAAAGTAPLTYPDPWVRARTAAGIALRYLVMAATGYGVAAFQEPPAAASWLDPWWLASLPVLAAIALRAVVTFRRRAPEAIFWTWAGASWLPISQIFPFPFPIADRYLYFILPGLLGAALGALQAGLAALGRIGRADPERARRWRLDAAPAALAVAGLALLLAFGAHAQSRARLWGLPNLLMADSAARFPEGSSALLLEARRAGQVGDERRAVAALRKLSTRGWNRFDSLLQDPAYLPVRDGPQFRALLRDMAAWWIARIQERESPQQLGLHLMGLAHELRGEDEAALRAMERALAVGGPADDLVRAERDRLRAKLGRGEGA